MKTSCRCATPVLCAWVLQILLTGGLILGSLVPHPVHAENNEPLTLNLKDADIRSFISSMSELTHRNFVVDPRVQGKVTVISAMPTDPDALYQVFVSILRVHGYAAIPSGNVIKIVPDASALTEAAAPPDHGAGGEDEIVTRVIPLKYVQATALVPILRPLMPAEAHLAAHAASNAIIASDTRANVERIARIIGRVDKRNDSAVEVIHLEHANAEDLARVLNSIKPQTAEAAQGGGSAPSVTADKRTNSILLGGDPNARLELRALISHLDTPVVDDGNTEVIYLHYAAAKDMAAILDKLGKKLQDKATGATTAAAPATTDAGGDSKVTILADDPTNALVVEAPPAKMRAIKSVIRALDIRRAQVYVEGVIAEVTNSTAAELGVQWRTNNPSNGILGGIVLPGTSSGDIQDLTTGGSAASAAAALATGLTLGFVEGGTIRSLLRLLASDSHNNVLSTPTLVTLDNEEAEIVVGQNVPFVTGQYTSTGTGQGVTNPFQTIEREDVGVKLKVEPQINEGNAVRLKISQEVSSVASSSTAADLITNKRSIKTDVLVDDGETVVIGGLIGDEVTHTTQKIPILGDIPLLGNLFKNQRNDRTKTNLMVFLRPTIIRDVKTADELTLGKYDFIRKQQTATRKKNRISLIPDDSVPQLPPFPSKTQDAAKPPGFHPGAHQ